jgi:hypothetical protein
MEEMSAFGHLFLSQKFDDDWAITQLKNALELSHRADPAYLVVQRLAALAATYPAIAIRCLALLVEGDKEDWGINSWGVYARTIIAVARRSEDEAIKQAAIELIHRLGAREHLEFQDLLR